MDSSAIFKEISDFCKEKHGSSNYDVNEVFIKGEKEDEFAPLNYLVKKFEDLKDISNLVRLGFVNESLLVIEDKNFYKWFEHQFSKKLIRRQIKAIDIYHLPENKKIFDAIETVHKSYEILRDSQILLNGKNLPVQLGEWYAKCIFGLQQRKSTSQRGFDFYMEGKRAEVKVHWSDQPSPKGVKIRKSMVDLSEYCIIIYVARNFMIRELCFLDCNFVSRKFSGKGHHIFLKDTDIATYFFSKSPKHIDKVMNKSALLKYATPSLAMKIAE